MVTAPSSCATDRSCARSAPRPTPARASSNCAIERGRACRARLRAAGGTAAAVRRCRRNDRCAPQNAEAEGGMPTHRTLIRGGFVITMDPALGDLPSADVLIDGERIAAIAPHLAADDCALIDARRHIVLPGFVDTHRHTWQTQLRAICADWTLGDYFSRIRLGITPAYTADDVYVGNYVGGLEALHAGVTTFLDFSHCMNSPDHADAAVQGLRDAGVRALHCYGFFAAAPNNRAFADHAQRCADFGRIARTYGGSAGGLITIGAALTEVGLVGWPETTAEVAAARQARAR